MARRFNASDRSALYIAADGKCESCGNELQLGWHADHVHPYSRGGPTDVINGAALCPPCNQQKGNKIMTDPRDRWQAEAFEAFFGLRKDSFLIDACPGAGKTRAVTNICVEALRRNWVDQVIIVAPTLEVQNQWAEDSHELGLDLTKNYKNGQMKYRSDAHGVITNYQTVAMSPKDWLILSTRSKRTLVVFDEIHHAADDETKPWGTALMTAFNQVTHRILLTGTPFRTDGGRIPWVTYDSKNSIADGGITTKQAVEEGVIRPIRIVAMESQAKWNKGAKDYVETAATVKQADQSNLLTAFFDPSGNYMDTTLRGADDELTRLREMRPNAGGLIIADSKENAEKLAARMSVICGEKVEFVHSGDLEVKPSELIDRFRNGNARWIVAVDMISEGVNIPRLCVGVYGSRKMTKLWFRQIVGRFVRQIGDDVLPTLYIPNLPDLTKHARELEDDQEAGLKQQQEVIFERYRQQQFDYDPTIVLGTSDAVMNQIIERDDTIEDIELRSTEEQMMRAGIPINGTNVADFAKYDRAAAGFADRNSLKQSPAKRPRTATNDQLLKNLRDQINIEVNKKARQTGQEHKQIYAFLNKQQSDTLATASIPSAMARLAWLRT